MTDIAFELAAAIKYALDKASVQYAEDVPKVAAETIKPLVVEMQKLTAELDDEVDKAWAAFEQLAEATEVAGLNKEVDELIARYRKEHQDGEKADVPEEYDPRATADSD